MSGRREVVRQEELGQNIDAEDDLNRPRNAEREVSHVFKRKERTATVNRERWGRNG